MRLLTQKSGEEYCLLYCAAMLLELPIESVILHIGTNGIEKWWPDYSPPKCYRGIHIQEIQDLFISYGKALIYIEKFPMLAPCQDERMAKPIYNVDRCEMRFYARLVGNSGILIYESHAKVLDHNGRIYDPNGKISEICPRESSLCREAWLVGHIKTL